MAVTYNTGEIANVSFASSISFNFDIGSSNANKLVCIMASVQSSTTPKATTATIAGNSATAFGAAFQTNNGSPANYARGFYYSTSSLSGSQSFVVNYDSSAGKPFVFIMVFDNAGVVGNYASSTGQLSLTPSWTVNSTSGNTCVSMMIIDSTNTITAGSNTTLDITAVDAANDRVAGFHGTAAGSTLVLHASITSPTPSWNGILFDVAPVGSGPTINTQPSNTTVVAGTLATFTVSATASAGSLTYQWYRNTVLISGATSSSFITPTTSVSGGTANNGDVYYVNVVDSNGNVNSSNATLSVNAATTGGITSLFGMF